MNHILTYPISKKALVLPKISLISLRFLGILSSLLVILLFAFYVFQVSDAVSRGYQLQNYQKRLNQLSEESKLLEINSVQIHSLGSVEKRIQEMGFEKVGKIHYIQILESQIATKP